MILTKISNHVQRAKELLIQQYKGKPRIEALLASVTEEVQEFENAIFDTYEGRLLFEFRARGEQLDRLGSLIGLARNGLSDEQYFTFLLGTISQNNSDTTADRIITNLRLLYDAEAIFIKSPTSPGMQDEPAFLAFGIGSPKVQTDLYPLIEQVLRKSVGAGITISYIYKFDARGTFSMAGPQAWNAGFGDLNDPNVGGRFSTLIYNNEVQELDLNGWNTKT